MSFYNVVETIQVTVLNYFGHPEFYPYMPDVVFFTLQEAFLNLNETADVPKDEFIQMINNYNRCVYASYKDSQEATSTPHYYILRNYQTSEN